MTALSDAAQDVAEVRGRILARLGMAVGGYDRDRDERLADALIAAVRHHDAEQQRAHHANQGIPCAGHGCPVLEVINLIDPKERP